MVGCGIICTYGLVTLLAASLVQCLKIHEHMTDDEIADLFHTSPDNVPEYDVVSIRHNLYKRSTPNLRLQFNAFGKKIDAYLQPSDGVLAGQNTPVWLASTNPNGTVEYQKMPKDTIGTVVKTFISISGLSTIVAFMPEGEKVSFKGFIDGLKVQPLRRKFRLVLTSGREVEFSNASRTLVDSHHHVIIKSASLVNQNDMLKNLDAKIHKTRVLDETNYSKSKRSTKDIIYPSVLVATDFAPSNITQDEFAYYDEIVYQLAFWNAVDLRFRHVDNPKIRLRIAGIIIGLDRKATPYANKYRNGDVINLPEYFSDSDDYWFAMSKGPDFPLQAFDIVATITDTDLTYTRNGTVKPVGGKFRIKWGLSFTGSLCLRSSNKFYANAIIEDKGGFTSVLWATHELGHILGLNHDGQTGDECDQSNHYIMQPTTALGPKTLQWSPCSLRRLSYFLRNREINCVDQPAEFYPPGPEVQRLLPGDIVTTHKQCQSRGYHWACETSTETCTNMACYYTGWKGFIKGWWCKDAGPAAEGTTCSPGHRCFDGVCQCVSEECASKKT